MNKKIFIIVFLITILCGCEKNIKSEIINKKLVFEYGDSVKYSDIIDINNGMLISDNEIDYKDAGDLKITIPYKNNNGFKKEYEVIIYLNDNTLPIISLSNNISVLKGADEDLCKRAFYADNADRQLECKIIGDYDFNKIGSYKLKMNIIDNFNNIAVKDFTLHVVNKFGSSSGYDVIDDPIEDMINKFKKENTEIGIDVSSHQGNIDWKQVKESGVEFAILRLGYGHTTERKLMLDNQFINNIEGAKKEGIKVGVYFFSYATEIFEVDEQTNFIIEQLSNYDLDLPIAFDFESWKGFPSYNVNILDMNKVYLRFKNNLESKGYSVMNYGSKYYLNNIWDSDNYTTWLAHYGYSTNYDKDYYIWQFTNTGLVPGIKGYVDLNILYK